MWYIKPSENVHLVDVQNELTTQLTIRTQISSYCMENAAASKQQWSVAILGITFPTLFIITYAFSITIQTSTHRPNLDPPFYILNSKTCI